MLRYAIAILFTLNIAFFGWTQGWFGEKPGQRGHEPTRIEAQTRPDAIQIAPPSDGTTMQPSDENTNGSNSINDANSSEPPIFLCLESGPLNGAQSSLLQRIVGDILPQDLWEMDVYTTASSWAVYLGPFKSEEASLQRKNELDRIEIDSVIVRNKPQHQPGITLGLFRELSNAEKMLKTMHAKGITEAKIEPWTLSPTGQLLRVTQASQEQRELLDALIASTDIPVFTPCEIGRHPL